MTLKEIMLYLKSLETTFSHYYLETLDSKKDDSLGIYNSKRPTPFFIALGGLENTSYCTKSVSLLIHGTRDFSATEAKAIALYKQLMVTPKSIGTHKINYIKLFNNEPIFVNRDNQGICEFVIDFEINYQVRR